VDRIYAVFILVTGGMIATSFLTDGFGIDKETHFASQQEIELNNRLVSGEDPTKVLNPTAAGIAIIKMDSEKFNK